MAKVAVDTQYYEKGYDFNIVVAIDFDGTITKKDAYPAKPCMAIKPIAKWACRQFSRLNIVTVLWTCRNDIEEAVDLCEQNGIFFDYINEYPVRGNPKKVQADLYIDDKNPAGCCWVLAVAKLWWRVKWSSSKTKKIYSESR